VFIAYVGWKIFVRIPSSDFAIEAPLMKVGGNPTLRRGVFPFGELKQTPRYDWREELPSMCALEAV